MASSPPASWRWSPESDAYYEQKARREVAEESEAGSRLLTTNPFLYKLFVRGLKREDQEERWLPGLELSD